VPGAAQIRFTLVGVEIEGSTVYQAADLAPLYAEFLAREVGTGDLDEIARRITAKYRTDGYILSRAMVPAQRISAGIVRIQIIEGFIDGTRIEGSFRGDRALLERYLEKISASRPLRAADLERYLLLANDLPGVSARAVLAASPTQLGASDLTLLVDQDVMQGSASLDNRGTRYVGPYQGQVGGTINSLLARMDQTQLRLIGTSQLEELRYGELTERIQIDDEGTQLGLAMRRTLSQPGYTLKPLEFESESVSGELTMTHPFIRSRPENLRGTLTLAYRDSTTTVLDTPFSKDRQTVLRAGGAYDFVDRLFGINLVALEGSRGLNVLGATETGSAGLSRSNGHSDFSKLTAQALRVQRLADSWSLLVGVNGQIANNPLLVGEEFSLGGADYGRAYDPSELTGDDGVGGKVELRYTLPWRDEVLLSSQLFTFYDIGTVWNQDPVAGEPPRASLASAGVGLRFDLARGISGSAEVDLPLTRSVAVRGDKDPRLFFSLSAAF
jgi:hemolysin activation/secretion protein